MAQTCAQPTRNIQEARDDSAPTSDSRWLFYQPLLLFWGTQPSGFLILLTLTSKTCLSCLATTVPLAGPQDWPWRAASSHFLACRPLVFLGGAGGRIIALQCCGGLCHTSTWVSHNHIAPPSWAPVLPWTPGLDSWSISACPVPTEATHTPNC